MWGLVKCSENKLRVCFIALDIETVFTFLGEGVWRPLWKESRTSALILFFFLINSMILCWSYKRTPSCFILTCKSSTIQTLPASKGRNQSRELITKNDSDFISRVFCPKWKETENHWVMFTMGRSFFIFSFNIWNLFVVSQNTANVESKAMVLDDEEEIRGTWPPGLPSMHPAPGQGRGGLPTCCAGSPNRRSEFWSSLKRFPLIW